MAKSTKIIITEILEFIQRERGHPNTWRVGVTNDPRRQLRVCLKPAGLTKESINMPTQGVSPVFLPPLINGMGAAAPIMENKTASWTCTAADSGKIFTTVGATANVTVTLPAIDTGPFMFTILHGADVNLTVASAVADTIITYGDFAADSVAFSTASEKIGGTVEVYCDGANLFVLARNSSSYQNVTVATA